MGGRGLGPVPGWDDRTARTEWQQRAGWAAAWRELSGHDSDDAADPLGAAPPRGLVEKAALFRAAHEALGLLDLGAEEAGMTDGQLRVRVHAQEREEANSPRYVADELAATSEAAQKARADATLFTARAHAPDVDDADRTQLQSAAQDAARKADELDLQVAQLEYADHARTSFFLHNVASRENAHRAGAELRARGVDPVDTSDHVTAAEWLAAHRATQAQEDVDREIREDYELHDEHTDDRAAGPPDDRNADARAGADVLDDASDEHDRPSGRERSDPAPRRRVLPVDETTALVTEAQQALARITARQQADAERAARDTEEAARAEELARWVEHDTADEQSVDDAAELDDAETALGG